MDYIDKYFGKKLKELRLEKGYTQRELGEKVGISDAAITQYEKGIREPKRNILFKLAEIFNISINDFFPDSEHNNQVETVSEEQAKYNNFDPDSKKIAEKISGRENLKILFDKIDDLTDEEIERIAKIIELTVPKRED